MTATAYTALARIAGGSRLSLSVHITKSLSVDKLRLNNFDWGLGLVG